MGIFEKIRKADRVVSLQFVDDGRELVLGQMSRQGEVLRDTLKGQEFAIVTDSANLTVRQTIKPGKYHVYLLDPGCGATVELAREPGDGQQKQPFICNGVTCELARDTSILKTRTNANLIASVMSSRIIQQAFAIRPDMSQIIITGIICMICGAAIGKLF